MRCNICVCAKFISNKWYSVFTGAPARTASLINYICLCSLQIYQIYLSRINPSSLPMYTNMRSDTGPTTMWSHIFISKTLLTEECLHRAKHFLSPNQIILNPSYSVLSALHTLFSNTVQLVSDISVTGGFDFIDWRLPRAEVITDERTLQSHLFIASSAADKCVKSHMNAEVR